MFIINNVIFVIHKANVCVFLVVSCSVIDVVRLRIKLLYYICSPNHHFWNLNTV